MTKKSLIAMVALVFLGAGTVSAQTVSIFGVKQFNKTQGGPVTFTDSFKVPHNVTDYVLFVQNGSGTKDDAKNFSISVNGEEVVSSKSMKHSSRIQIPVNLLPENTLSVTMRGQAGDSLFIDVQGKIEDSIVVDTQGNIIENKK